MALVRKPSILLGATILVMLTLLLLILVATEALLRFQVGGWPFEENIATYSHMTTADRTLRWRYPPGDGRNSLGFRNREVVKKTSQVRVLFLGDSLVFTGDTSTDQLFTRVVEDNLNNFTN